MMKRHVFVLTFATAFAASAEFVWPDSTVTPEPTIPAGETVEVTDVSTINGYTSVTIESGATLQLNTATPPTVALKGTGTIEKNGSQVWNMTTQQTEFKGSYYIKAGVVSNSVDKTYTFGYGASATSPVKIYVDGGTLVVFYAGKAYNHIVFRYEKLYLAGTGVNGMGALVWNNAGSTDGNLLKNGITLTDDATISLYSAYLWPHGNINLNNHTLTYGGTMTGVFAYLSRDASIVGPGDIHIPRAGTSTVFREFNLRPSPSLSLAALFAETDPLTRFVLAPYTRLGLFCDDSKGKIVEYTTPIKAALHVDGGATHLKHYHRYSSPTNGFYHEKPVTWAGPITFADSSSELIIYNYDNDGTTGKYCDQNVSGHISGPGKLRIGQSNTARGPGRVSLSNPTNSYTGVTCAYLTGTGSLALYCTNAIPNYSKLSCYGGRVSLMLTDTDNNWTDAAIAKIANEATWVDNAVLSLDGLLLTDKRTVSSDEGWLAAITNKDVCLGVEHGLTLDVRAPISRNGLNSFAAGPGSSVKFSGDGKMELGGITNRGPSEEPGLFEFNGADVTIVTNGMYIGSGVSALMVVTNHSSIVMDESASATWKNAAGSKTYSNVRGFSIRLGCESGLEGILEMDSTSFISNRIAAGHASGARGAVYQRGGTVFNTSGTYDDAESSFPHIGGVGHGYWELTENATLVQKCRPIVGYYAPGILHIDGGSEVSQQYNEKSPTTQPWFYLSYSAPGEVYIKDGTLNLLKTYPIIGGYAYYPNWRATITLDGPNACYKAYGPSCAYHVGWAAGGGGKFYINMNDGVFESVAINRRGIATRTNPDIVYLNFNGGTFKSYIESPFPEYRSATNNYWFAATVYAGGAKIDTTPASTIVRIPIKGATGNGISAVPLPATIASGTFAAPPYVRITGDGDGATAYAIFDSRTRKVTGVRVTSPGFDYTEAWAEDVYGTSVLVSNACTLAANTSGDFTKAGANTLTLNGTNTWGGCTILAGGTLKCGVDHAIPATTTFVMAGGLLNMNGKTLSDDSTVPMKWGVDLDQVRESGTVTYAGNVTFPEGATLEVIGGDTLSDSDARSMVLLRMTGTVTGTPAITGVTDPRWNVSWANRTLSLKRFTGSTFTIR